MLPKVVYDEERLELTELIDGAGTWIWMLQVTKSQCLTTAVFKSRW